MKKSIDDAFVVLGMIFLVLIIFSMFSSVNSLSSSSKIYLLIIFVGIVSVNYYRFRKKRSNNE